MHECVWIQSLVSSIKTPEGPAKVGLGEEEKKKRKPASANIKLRLCHSKQNYKTSSNDRIIRHTESNHWHIVRSGVFTKK